MHYTASNWPKGRITGESGTGEDNVIPPTRYASLSENLPCHVIRSGWLTGHVSEETCSLGSPKHAESVGTGSGQDSRKQNWHWVIEKWVTKSVQKILEIKNNVFSSLAQWHSSKVCHFKVEWHII